MVKHPELMISVVTYNTDPLAFSACLDSILQINVPFKCCIVDNSRNAETLGQVDEVVERLPEWGEMKYVPSKNIGYGKSHNSAIREFAMNMGSPFHLVMNPDICFNSGTIETLLDYMHHHETTGLVMPKIVYPDQSFQKLCKLLPTPGILLARRFFPWFSKKQNSMYQLEFMDYNKPFECPSLSGCFMLLRTDALKEIGLFDDRYFMYFEDVDLVRRIGQKYKTMYYPEATVIHHYRKESYSSIRLLLNHLVSGIKYFNKWGWFIDRERNRINEETIQRLKMSNATNNKIE